MRIKNNELDLLIETYKYLYAEGCRLDLAAALLRTINRLASQRDQERGKTYYWKQFDTDIKPKKLSGAGECLYQRLLDAGYPAGDMFSHESDLYVFVTPLTTKIIGGWCKEMGYNPHWHCPTFVDQETGKLMYDCAFQYTPYWERCAEKSLSSI